MQIDGGSRERFFRRPFPTAVGKNTRLVLLMAIGVESHRPSVLVTEVPQATKMNRRIAHPLEKFFTGLTRYFQKGFFWLLWFGIGVDVAEFSVEANINPCVLSRVMFLGVVLDALIDPWFDRIGDLSSTGLGIVDPCSSGHRVYFLSNQIDGFLNLNLTQEFATLKQGRKRKDLIPPLLVLRHNMNAILLCPCTQCLFDRFAFIRVPLIEMPFPIKQIFELCVCTLFPENFPNG